MCLSRATRNVGMRALASSALMQHPVSRGVHKHPANSRALVGFISMSAKQNQSVPGHAHDLACNYTSAAEYVCQQGVGV